METIEKNSAPLESPRPLTTYEKAMKALETEMDEIDGMIPSMEVVDEAAALFPALRPSTVAVGSTRTVLLTIHIASMKEVAQVARLFALRGYHIKEFQDDERGYYRRFYYRSKTGLEIQLFAQLSRDEKAVCRFEKVGVKEQPVYKLVCG